MKGLSGPISRFSSAFEQTYQIRVLSTELIPDSAGAGRHRGGLGVRRVYEILEQEQAGLAYTEQADQPSLHGGLTVVTQGHPPGSPTRAGDGS